VSRVHTVSGGGGLALHVREAGDPAAPPILFIHGFSQGHLCWRRQIAGALAERFRLVVFDLRGHGMSGRPPPEAFADGDEWADDIAGIIAGLGLDRPVIVAWSYGGLVLGDYLRRHGGAGIAGIVLVAALLSQGQTRPPPGPDSPFLSADQAVAIPHLRSFVERMTAAPLPAAELAELVAMNVLVPPETRRGLLLRKVDLRPAYAQARCPALVVRGSADALVPRAEVADALAALPQAGLKEYEGVGHMPFWESPERFNGDLAAFAAQAREAA